MNRTMNMNIRPNTNPRAIDTAYILDYVTKKKQLV